MRVPSNTASRTILIVLALCLLVATVGSAQDRPKSPKGSAATQIGDAWIDVTYSRPILRGRQDRLFNFIHCAAGLIQAFANVGQQRLPIQLRRLTAGAYKVVANTPGQT